MNNFIPNHSQQLLPTNPHTDILDTLKHLNTQRAAFAIHDDKVSPFYTDDLQINPNPNPTIETFDEPFFLKNIVEIKWLRKGIFLLIVLIFSLMIISFSSIRKL